jgi:hypothetical protein
MKIDPAALAVAVAGVLAAMTALITALTAFWRVLKENTKTTNETHAMVNSKSDDDSVFRQNLIGALNDHDIAVPENPADAAAVRRVREADGIG